MFHCFQEIEDISDDEDEPAANSTVALVSTLCKGAVKIDDDPEVGAKLQVNATVHAPYNNQKDSEEDIKIEGMASTGAVMLQTG